MKIVAIIPILNPEESFFKKIVPLLLNQTVSIKLVCINSGDMEVNIENSEVL